MSLFEVKDLSKSCSECFGIDKISFEIQEKGVYGFFGKSGSGKTLLSMLLVGICEADSGAIIYKDKDLCESEAKAAQIKRKIGYVPAQSVFPNDMSVEEVLDFTGMTKKISPDKRARQIKEALTLTGLENKAELLVECLTPSEKKRMAYANALIGNTDILIIDEPITAIDSAQRDEIKKLISMLGKMKVVILFAKNPTDIESLCNYVGILGNGALLVYDSLDAMLAKLNKTVMALLRVKKKGSDVTDIMQTLRDIDGISGVKKGNSTGLITDVVLDCSTRDGVQSAVNAKMTELGVDVVSFKFTTLGISDVMDALCVDGAREV